MLWESNVDPIESVFCCVLLIDIHTVINVNYGHEYYQSYIAK